MGCATSKLDDLPAVAPCRERCAFLDEALRLSFALADAHAAYLQSLKAVGLSMHTFFIQDLDTSAHRLSSPVLNLPPKRKGDPHRPSSSSSKNIHHFHSHSHSHSGSHLHFHSDSDDEEADSLHNNQVSSPVRNQQSYVGYMPAYENLNCNFSGAAAGGGGGFMHINYMKNQATPSVVHTQRLHCAGLLIAIILKGLYLGRHSSVREISLMVLMAYLSYMLAELLSLSGILTVFFTGIFMSHYVWHNVTDSSRITTKHVFAMMSFITEAFIFLYVGTDALDIEKWKMSKLRNLWEQRAALSRCSFRQV